MAGAGESIVQDVVELFDPFLSIFAAGKASIDVFDPFDALA